MIVIDDKDIEQAIDSPDELDYLLKKYNLKKYINYQESFDVLYEKFPFIRDLEYDVDIRSSFSSIKMNKYLGYALIPYGINLSSFIINVFLNAYFEKEKINKWLTR